MAIDPDVDKSGVCIMEKDGKRGKITSLSSLGFADLVKSLVLFDGDVVIIEAGWMNKSNWHIWHNTPPFKAAKMGESVGRNQQVGHCLAELCEGYNIPYIEVAPLSKGWKGKDGKISHEELSYFCELPKKRTNQEERDAVLLAWTNLKLPIKAKVWGK